MTTLKKPINLLMLALLGTSAFSVNGQSEVSNNGAFDSKKAKMVVQYADVNGDGFKDIINSNPNTNVVQFFLNLLPNQPLNVADDGATFALNSSFSDFICFDLNKDKLPEIIVADMHLSVVTIHNNNSSKTEVKFAPPIAIATEFVPSRLLACDLNFDGNIDLIAAGKHNVEIFRNNTNTKGAQIAMQQGQLLTVDALIIAIKCADMDGDGYIDIVVCTDKGYTIFIGKGETDGFAKSLTSEEFTIVSGMDIGDLDGDYLPELILSHWPQNQVTIIRNISQAGRPSFTNEKAFECLGAASIALSDYNQDGLFDIVTLASGQGWQLAEVFVNKTAAQGRFAFMAPELLKLDGSRLITVDIDNNGYDDFITSNDTNGLINIIYNKGANNQTNFNAVNVFCGEDGFAWIDWSVQQEALNTNYIIEKSLNGADFFEIGTIASNSSSEVKSEYTFTDNTIFNEIAAYRIKMVSKTMINYSAVILLNPCDNVVTNFVCVFPNPVEKVMNFQFSIKAEMQIHFEIMDAAMQTKLEKAEMVTPGTRTYSLDITQLEKGTYLLAVRFGNLAPEVCRFEKL